MSQRLRVKRQLSTNLLLVLVVSQYPSLTLDANERKWTCRVSKMPDIAAASRVLVKSVRNYLDYTLPSHFPQNQVRLGLNRVCFLYLTM